MLVQVGRHDLLGVAPRPDAGDDAPDVRIECRDGLAERESCDGRRRVGADTREPAQKSRVARHPPAVLLDQGPRSLGERHRAAVVPEPGPRTHDVVARSPREIMHGWEPIEEPLERRADARGLGLLEHHLGHQDRVRIARSPPGVPAPARTEPGTQGFRERARLATLLPEIMVTVREVMSTALVTVEPSTSIAEAATVMGGRHVGSAIVLGDGGVSGIFTERDVLRALATDFDAAHHAVEQWMTRNPATIAPEAPVRDARELMLERGFRHLPVVEDGNLVGIVSLRDLLRGEP